MGVVEPASGLFAEGLLPADALSVGKSIPRNSHPATTASINKQTRIHRFNIIPTLETTYRNAQMQLLPDDTSPLKSRYYQLPHSPEQVLAQEGAALESWQGLPLC